MATWWLVYAQSARRRPTPFLVVMTLRLSVLFAGFGLIAKRNPTTVVSLFICGVVVSTSVFLILEMNRPPDGWIRISRSPLGCALSQLGR